MRTLCATTAALVATLVLSACSDGNADPGDSMSTWTPSGTIEKPSETATEKPTEPDLPDAATKATEDGARAFIAYYWDVVNYAQVTGDVKPLKRVSGTTCDGCQRAIKVVEDLYREGGHAEGGQYDLTIDRVKEVSTDDRALFGMEATIQVRNEEQRIVRGGGEEEISAPKTSKFISYLIWTGKAWRTDVLEPR